MIERLRHHFARLHSSLRLGLRPRVLVALVLVALAGFALGALVFGSSGRGVSDGAHEDSHAQHGAKQADATLWTCAMHPQIRQPGPGICPLCAMDLIPLASDGSEDAPPSRITLSERAKALARLRTTEVRRVANPTSELSLLGRVESDETRTRTVTAWIGGRIDRLHVKVTGARVGAGQTVATLYSPEVLAAHQDLIAARRQVERMQEATGPARTAADATLDAVRDRLRLLGVPEDRVGAMESEQQPARQVPIRSAFAGTVIERMAAEGAYVTTGEPLYRIADLSKVWVQLDAYERDLAALQVGQVVAVSVEALPGETVEGRVAFIDPIIDTQRRTARVRVEVVNEAGRLMPGMFAQAVVQASTRAAQKGDASKGVAGKPAQEAAADRPLVVPRTAPLFTGQRAIVYVEVPQAERPTYEARTVRLAPRTGDVYPVVAGLVEGERIVTRGAFVLDADLQIRGGNSMMTGPDDSDEGPWDQAIEISAGERRKLQPVLVAYLALQQALAGDDLPGAQQAGASLVKHAAEVRLARPQAASEAWLPLARDLGQHGAHITEASSLESARGGFEVVSLRVQALLRRFGNPLDRALAVAFCPMASGRGATWVQTGNEVDNPYFGDSMRTCGTLREHVSPGAYLAQVLEPRNPPSAAAHEGHQH